MRPPRKKKYSNSKTMAKAVQKEGPDLIFETVYYQALHGK